MTKRRLASYGLNLVGVALLYALITLAFTFNAFGKSTTYIQGICTTACYTIIMVTSLNLVVGFMGEFSMGHAGFVSVGAYVSAIVSGALAGHGLSDLALLLVAILAGGLAAGIMGVAVGIPALRLRGDYLAIMGPSGSGKTTLMNIIGCLDVPTSGTYELDGQNLKDMDDDELADIRNKHLGFVFQSFYLMPKLTALDNVALPLLYAGVSLKERRERAAEALKAVGLEERMDFFPNQLSGGQCQRVAIARAMVGKPDLLLADEPTGALDTKAGNQIMDIFRRLSDEGMTILMITHELAIAQCADKIYHILDGQLRTYDEQQEGGAGNEEAE